MELAGTKSTSFPLPIQYRPRHVPYRTLCRRSLGIGPRDVREKSRDVLCRAVVLVRPLLAKRPLVRLLRPYRLEGIADDVSRFCWNLLVCHHVLRSLLCHSWTHLRGNSASWTLRSTSMSTISSCASWDDRQRTLFAVALRLVAQTVQLRRPASFGCSFMRPSFSRAVACRPGRP
jgi:hypothetical protein